MRISQQGGAPRARILNMLYTYAIYIKEKS
jgi:hypothetical protein